MPSDTTPARSRRATLGALFAVTGAVLLAPSRALAALRRETAYLFGSPVELLVPEDAPAAAVDGVLAQLRAIHSRWNAWKPGELGALNEAFRSGRSAAPSPSLRALMHAATRLEVASAGYFNAGIGGLVGAWGFHADRLEAGPSPHHETLERWRTARPSLTQLEWRGGSVSSRNPALQLDFGAIGKGFAIDRALDRLAAAGVRGALLNLGGNLAAMGDARGRPWMVGIRDPASPALAATLQIVGREAVVTSGSYERFRQAGAERVHHIIEPATGRPAPGLASVTVVHRSATVADAAATALLAAGPARWPAVAQRMGVDGVVAIDHAGHVEVTLRLRDRVRLADGSGRG